MKPEIGTYGEPDWVTQHPDGTLIEEEDIVLQNRVQFFKEKGFATDNTLIQSMFKIAEKNFKSRLANFIL